MTEKEDMVSEDFIITGSQGKFRDIWDQNL